MPYNNLPNKNTKRIGLYGGSFDPIHLAHIDLAQTAKAHLNLDELQVIPAANPWQRQPLKASPQHRLKMLEIALEQHSDWLKINDIEINRGGKSYTIDTLNQLPPNDYYWIMGSDQLENFCSWHKWQEITQLVKLTVAKRPDHSVKPPAQLLEYLGSLNKSIIEIPFTQYEISATKIRYILQQNKSNLRSQLQDLIPNSVLNYIIEHNLYT